MQEYELKSYIYGSFLNLINRYNLILNQYYPAHDSTGFTERNLTCNFAESLRSIFDKEAFIWYETPIDKKRHIDAAVFSQKHNAAFFIEAKRLGQEITRQIGNLKNDLKRIEPHTEENNQELDRIDYIIQNLKWNNNPLDTYIVFICDYWDENEIGFNEIEDKLKTNFENFDIISQKGFYTNETQYSCLNKYSIFLGWKKV